MSLYSQLSHSSLAVRRASIIRNHGHTAWVDEFGVLWTIEVSTKDGQTFERVVQPTGNVWHWLGY